MKITLFILSMAFLTGCSTIVPVKQKFPEVPPALLEACPPLLTISEDQNNIRDFMAIVVKNYSAYHSCASRVSGWQEWHKKTEKIMNGK